jgi:hypothetical protein
MCHHKTLRIDKVILGKKMNKQTSKNDGGLTIPIFSTYYKALLTKMAYYHPKNRHINRRY